MTEESVASPPVLLVIFNRPENAAHTFARIRAARPSKLFIHADGPRADRLGEDKRCLLARQATEQIDWPCDVHRLYRDQNLGCGPGVSSAITWFFEHVDEGIILEDDCLPHPAFFDFCSRMLARFRTDPQVMHVAGCGFTLHETSTSGAKINLLPLPFIWGWATWRRAWRLYSFTLPSETHTRPVIHRMNTSPLERDFWTVKIDETRRGSINTWDYQWVFTLWSNAGLAVTPTFTLITNEGVGADFTHEQGGHPDFSKLLEGHALPILDSADCPHASEAMKELNQRIFHIRPSSLTRRFEKTLRPHSRLWSLYLGLRRRWLSIKPSR